MNEVKVVSIIVSRDDEKVLLGVIVKNVSGELITVDLNKSMHSGYEYPETRKAVSLESLDCTEDTSCKLYMSEDVLSRELVNIVSNAYGSYLNVIK